MTASIGATAVLLGFVLAAVGSVLAGLGAARADGRLVAIARLAALALLPVAAVAAGALTWALLAHDFSLSYVAQNGSRDTPTFYTAISLWARLEGSILLWVLVLSAFIAVTALTAARSAPQLFPVALTVLLAIAAFFFWMVSGPADPFVRVSPVPADGPGPNPLLQNHPLMAIHPPLLYVGLVGFSVPFAFALAALATGRLDDGWIRVTRRVTLVSWAALALGNVLGAAWSYAVLGWGGYFAWDPVENASLLPWLTATALIHSVLVQERRDMLRLWNLTLVVATFLLTILKTFLTRSGVLSSVHAFADGVVGPALLGFIGVWLVVSVALLVWRGERVRGAGELDAPVCRESALLLNNLLLVGVTLTVLLGTLFPLFAEAINGSRLSVGEPYFTATTVPLMLALLFLMGVGPALPWRKASARVVRQRLWRPALSAVGLTAVVFAAGIRQPVAVVAILLGGFVAAHVAEDLVRLARRRALAAVPRRVGGQIAHLGVAAMAMGIAVSSTYEVERQATLRPGESLEVRGTSVRFERLQRLDEPRRQVIRAHLVLDDGRRLQPALNVYRNATQATASPGIHTGALTDVYALLVEDSANRSSATIRVFAKPMVSWIWAGGALLLVGAGIALMPASKKRRA